MSITAGNLDLHAECRPRVGCFDGHSPRLNERVIDDQWTGYLAEYTELVRIPPVRFAKIFGGSLRQFSKQPMSSLPQASERLARLCEEYGMDTLYVNAPYFMPFLMLVRSFAKLPLRFMVIAHSVASARWLTTWLSCAPWITEQDVLLASTESCRQALVNISPGTRMPIRFRYASTPCWLRSRFGRLLVNVCYPSAGWKRSRTFMCS